MNHKIKLASLIALSAALSLGIAATGSTDVHEAAAPAVDRDFTIDDAALLAGNWRTDNNNTGFAEEIWSAPAHGGMVGAFRWLRPDGTVVLYELLSIAETDDGVICRMRHFDAEMQPWENEEWPVTLRVTAATDDSVTFSTLEGDQEEDVAEITYRLNGDALNASVRFRDASRPPIELGFTRAE